MSFKVKLSNKARKTFRKIPQPWKKKISIYLDMLSFDPYIGKKLEGKYKNDYSIRVWPFRIIYTIKKKELIIEVIEIEYRGSAYGK